MPRICHAVIIIYTANRVANEEGRMFALVSILKCLRCELAVLHLKIGKLSSSLSCTDANHTCCALSLY